MLCRSDRGVATSLPKFLVQITEIPYTPTVRRTVRSIRNFVQVSSIFSMKSGGFHDHDEDELPQSKKKEVVFQTS